MHGYITISIGQYFYNIYYDEPWVNILCHRNMTPPTIKHLFGNYQMDIYCDACMNHTPSHNHMNWQTFYSIYYYKHFKAVSRTWTKQNFFHEIGPQKNTGIDTSVNKICPLSSVSLIRRSFTGKKVLWHNNNIINPLARSRF